MFELSCAATKTLTVEATKTKARQNRVPENAIFFQVTF